MSNGCSCRMVKFWDWHSGGLHAFDKALQDSMEEPQLTQPAQHQIPLKLRYPNGFTICPRQSRRDYNRFHGPAASHKRRVRSIWHRRQALRNGKRSNYVQLCTPITPHLRAIFWALYESSTGQSWMASGDLERTVLGHVSWKFDMSDRQNLNWKMRSRVKVIVFGTSLYRFTVYPDCIMRIPWQTACGKPFYTSTSVSEASLTALRFLL